MNGPNRLIDGGLPPDELALLRAGIDDGPPDGALDRALLKAGLGAGAAAAAMTATSTTSAAAGSGASGWAFSALGKVAIGVGVSVFALTVVKSATMGNRGAVPSSVNTGDAVVAQPPSEVAPGASAAVSTGEAPKPPPQAPAVEAPSSATAPSAAVSARVPADRLWALSAPESADSIARQTAAIDGARRALESGNVGGALADLDGYEREFPRGAFGHEVTALRVQALLKKGDRAAAMALGKRFLAAHPRSPLARRIEAMLHLSNDPR
jgi:hypothetical protein